MSVIVAKKIANKLRNDSELRMPVQWAKVRDHSQNVLESDFSELELDVYRLMLFILPQLYGVEGKDWKKVKRPSASGSKMVVFIEKV